MSDQYFSVQDWLATHLVAMGFLVFLLVAVIWRGPLFGLEPAQNKVQEAPPASVERVRPSQPLSDPSVESENAVSAFENQPAKAVEQETPKPSGVDEPSHRAVEKPVFRPPELVVQEAVVSPPESVEDAKEEPAVSSPVDVVEAPVAVVVEVPVAAEAITLPTVERPELTLVELQELLQSARAVFWNGDLEKAEQLYLAYLAQRPEDANVFGELGNLYQSMGMPLRALDAYFEAGLRFRANGEMQQLDQIHALLQEAGDPRYLKLQN